MNKREELRQMESGALACGLPQRLFPGRRRRLRARRRDKLTLPCEVLEVRLVPSTFTWTGGGANSNWSTGANWQGGVSPTSGSTLVFGVGQSQLTNVDDIVGLSVAEIQLAGGYSISGNAITLTGSGGVGIDSQSATNTFSSPITLGASLAFTEDAGQLTLGGVISGSQSLTKGGPGTLVQSGANTYSGTTTVSAGTLSIAADSNLGTAPGSNTPGSVTINGGTLATTGTFTLSARRGISLGASGGTVDVSSGTILTYSGIAASTGRLTKIDTGTLVLGGTNTYSGGTTVSAGTLSVAADKNLGTAPSLATPGSLTLSGGTLATTASFTLNAKRGISLGASGGTFDAASGTTLTYKGIAAGAGGLTKVDTGTLALGGVNSFTGVTTVSAGTLSIANDNNLGTPPGSPTPGSLTINGGTLATVSNFTLNSNRGISLGAAGGTIDVAAGTILTYNGIAAGTGGLTKTDTGTLVLGGANTYSGGTTVSAGKLSIASDNNLGIAPSSATPGSLTLSAGTLATTGSFTLSANRGVSLGASGGTIDAASGTALTYNGVAAGTGALTKIDTGTLVLGAANTYSGITTVSAGTLSIAADNNLGTPPSSATPGSVTINGGTLATTASFTLNANRGLSLGASGATIDAASGTTLTYSGIAAGAGKLTKIDAGTLVLGGANTYSGITTVSAGTLSIAADNNLGTAPSSATPGSLTINGGTLAATASFTLSANRGLSLGASGGTIDTVNGTTLTYNGIAAGTGNLTKIDTGTLVLGGANTYSGGTTVSAGTLKDGVANALPTATTLTVNGTGTFDLGGFAQTVGGLADGGVSTGTVTNSGAAATFTVNDGLANSFAGVITNGANALALTKTGAGTLTLSGVNSFTGVTTVTAGKLSVAVDSNLGAAPSSATPASLIINGGTLATTASFTLNANRGISLGASGGTIDAASGTTLTYNGIAAGTGGLTKIDTGTLLLGGANTYSGITTISAGTLTIAADNNLGTAPGSATPGSLTINGGTLATTASFTLSANRGFSLGASGVTIDTASGTTLIYSGIAAGTGWLTKIDTGTLVLGGANSYTGVTTVSAGTLSIAADNNLGIAPSSATPGSLTVNGGTLAATASFTLSANRGLSLGASGGTVDVASGAALIYGGIAAGAGKLTLVDNGTLVLGGANTYSGTTTISAGTLSIAADNNLGTAPSSATPGSLTINGGTLATTANFTLNANRGISLGASGATIDAASGTTLTYNGIAAGAGALTKIDTGTLVLGGANTYIGGTTVSAGTLKDGVANALPTTATLTVNGTGTFDLGGFAQTVGGLADGGVSTGTVTDSRSAATFTVNDGLANSFAGLITNGNNALALTKSGAGTLTLSNTNTFSGATTVNAGTLLVNGSQSGSILTVNGGAVLGGANGTVGVLNVSGGTVSPGAALGASGILYSGSVNFGSTSTYNVDLNGTTAGSGYDQLKATGTATISTSTILNVTIGTGFTPTVGNTFAIILSPNAISGTFASLPEGTTYGVGGQLFRISYLDDEVTLTCVGSATTALTSSLNPSIYGQTTTFTVTVSNSTGSGGVPTGGVEFYDGLNDLGSGTALSGSGTTATSTFTISTFTAGTHSIKAVYTSTGNFQGNDSSTLSQTVVPAVLTVTADDQNKVYGAALPTLTVTYSGFVNGDTSASLTTQPALTTTATASSHVSGNPYAITASGAVDTNYSISYVGGVLTVTPVALTLTANSQSKVYGAALPTLTATYTGFVNGDTDLQHLTEPGPTLEHNRHRRQSCLR